MLLALPATAAPIDDDAPRRTVTARPLQDGPAGARAAPREGDEEGPETEDMFGFTTGTDVLEKGKIEASEEAEGAFGRRAGRYRVGSFKSAVNLAPFEGFTIELGATASAFAIRNVPGLNDRHGGGLAGLSAEFKWQLVKRGPSAFGVTLEAEPRVGFLDEETGRRGRSRGVEGRLAVDTALVRDVVFAAANLVYEAEMSRPRGLLLLDRDGEALAGPFAVDENGVAFVTRIPVERSSSAGVSGALAVQALANVFVGAELRYRRAYEGLALQRFAGHALFAGPTLYAKLSERLSVSAAWSPQLAGRAAGGLGRLDLDNFSRHEAKLKASLEF